MPSQNNSFVTLFICVIVVGLLSVILACGDSAKPAQVQEVAATTSTEVTSSAPVTKGETLKVKEKKDDAKPTITVSIGPLPKQDAHWMELVMYMAKYNVAPLPPSESGCASAYDAMVQGKLCRLPAQSKTVLEFCETAKREVHDYLQARAEWTREKLIELGREDLKNDPSLAVPPGYHNGTAPAVILEAAFGKLRNANRDAFEPDVLAVLAFLQEWKSHGVEFEPDWTMFDANWNPPTHEAEIRIWQDPKSYKKEFQGLTTQSLRSAKN